LILGERLSTARIPQANLEKRSDQSHEQPLARLEVRGRATYPNPGFSLIVIWMLAAGIAAVVLVGFLANFVRARRAASLNPMQTLRIE
jgi:hypothetical protein